MYTYVHAQQYILMVLYKRRIIRKPHTAGFNSRNADLNLEVMTKKKKKKNECYNENCRIGDNDPVSGNLHVY